MHPLSNDLVRSMDEERRRTLRRHVRRQRRRRDEQGQAPRRREPLVWADESGLQHLVDREGVARLDQGSRAAAGPRTG